MRLIDIFNDSFKSVDMLLSYHAAFCSTKTKKPKSSWVGRIYSSKVVYWPRKNGFWRAKSKDANMLIIGNDKSLLREDCLHTDAMTVILRSALVMAMASIDKILHEAISYNFSSLLKTGGIDQLVNISLSDAYEIAIKSRERKGKGGKIKKRPGHMFKEKVLEELYRKSFLATQQLETVCASCDKKSIFSLYANNPTAGQKSEQLRHRWSKLYQKRNNIAHECDMIRKEKAKKIHYHPVSTSAIIDDIKFVKSFGQFLARELQA